MNMSHSYVARIRKRVCIRAIRLGDIEVAIQPMQHISKEMQVILSVDTIRMIL